MGIISYIKGSKILVLDPIYRGLKYGYYILYKGV